MYLPATFNLGTDHHGGCYTCRYFGRHVGADTVKCAKPDDEHLRAQAQNGCAYWRREAGAEPRAFLSCKLESPAKKPRHAQSASAASGGTAVPPAGKAIVNVALVEMPESV